MTMAIRLTILTGPHRDHRFCFCGSNECQAGRAMDCLIQFSGTERDLLISRHHCRLEIEPPSAYIHDLGSRNGTYINGKLVEGRGEVFNGDLITVGGTTMRVDIVDCPHAVNAAGELGWDGATVKKDCQLACEG
ncbi:MAG: FHA domain-containing protein [Planctomycetes bacterium]|nr:FHA domain-containing protein [Planctomycetota bacterium]